MDQAAPGARSSTRLPAKAVSPRLARSSHATRGICKRAIFIGWMQLILLCSILHSLSGTFIISTGAPKDEIPRFQHTYIKHLTIRRMTLPTFVSRLFQTLCSPSKSKGRRNIQRLLAGIGSIIRCQRTESYYSVYAVMSIEISVSKVGVK